MSRQQKPRVITRCSANRYVGRSERIIEFSFADGSGGLINFSHARPADAHSPATPNIVNVYRTDDTVIVFHNGKGVGNGTR